MPRYSVEIYHEKHSCRLIYHQLAKIGIFGSLQAFNSSLPIVQRQRLYQTVIER